MSTTFHIEVSASDTLGFEISCVIADETGHVASRHPDFPAAEAAYVEAKAAGVVETGCCFIEPVRDPRLSAGMVNMSVSNALAVLDVLGFADPDDGSVDLCGSVSPDRLRGRILVARALASDVGIPAVSFPGAAGAEFVDCGRRPGYLTEKFAQLEWLCDAAEELGRNVVWA